MVAAAAHANRILFKHTVVGAGFAGVQQSDAGALQAGSYFMRIGCNAAHALQIVQRHALTGKQHANVTVHHRQLLAVLHGIAVLAEKLHLGGGVQQGKHPGKHLQTGHNAVLLGDQIHRAGAGMGHHRVGGYIFPGNIFAQGLQQQGVNIQQTSDLIHGIGSFQWQTKLLYDRPQTAVRFLDKGLSRGGRPYRPGAR